MKYFNHAIFQLRFCNRRQETVTEITLSSKQVPEEIPLPNESADVDKTEDDGIKVGEIDSNNENVESNNDNVESVTTNSEPVPSPQQALSEQEDKDSQAELVLTVEDNVMEEQTPSVQAEEE